MEVLTQLIQTSGFASLSLGHLVMFIIGGVLIYLAITREFEPLLLIPIGFGAILANLPLGHMAAGMNFDHGLMQFVYEHGVKTEFLPPVIFMGVGVLTNFRPLLSRPYTFLLGAAAQLGIFIAALGAYYLAGFNIREAASIGIIGGADGPTSIFLTIQLAPHLLGAVAVSAYSYMSLVPIIQPPIMRLLTTKKERCIAMPLAKPVSQKAVILFPIVTGMVAILGVPSSAPLVGMLMFGNLLRESGVTERLRKTVGSSLVDIVTIFLGLAIGATMAAESFLKLETIKILLLGAVAFCFSTAGGVLLAKFMNIFVSEKERSTPASERRESPLCRWPPG